MTRNFSGRSPAPGVVDRLLAGALRAPSAGNTQGREFVVLEGPGAGRRLLGGHDGRRRGGPGRPGSPGCPRAPVVVLVYADPDAYVARYREQDKSRPDGTGVDWVVPFWFVDAAFATMSLLLGAEDGRTGAAFLGQFPGRGTAPRGRSACRNGTGGWVRCCWARPPGPIRPLRRPAAPPDAGGQCAPGPVVTPGTRRVGGPGRAGRRSNGSDPLKHGPQGAYDPREPIRPSDGRGVLDDDRHGGRQSIRPPRAPARGPASRPARVLHRAGAGHPDRRRPAGRPGDRHLHQERLGAHLLPRRRWRPVDEHRPLPRPHHRTDPRSPVHPGPDRVHRPVHAEDGADHAHPRRHDAGSGLPAGAPTGQPQPALPAPRLAGRVVRHRRGDGGHRPRAPGAREPGRTVRAEEAPSERRADRPADEDLPLHRRDHRPDADRHHLHHDVPGQPIDDGGGGPPPRARRGRPQAGRTPTGGQAGHPDAGAGRRGRRPMAAQIDRSALAGGAGGPRRSPPVWSWWST